jgi:hypothetical protein
MEDRGTSNIEHRIAGLFRFHSSSGRHLAPASCVFLVIFSRRERRPNTGHTLPPSNNPKFPVKTAHGGKMFLGATAGVPGLGDTPPVIVSRSPQTTTCCRSCGLARHFGYSRCVNPKGCQQVAGGRRRFGGRRPPGSGAGEIMHPSRGASHRRSGLGDAEVWGDGELGLAPERGAPRGYGPHVARPAGQLAQPQPPPAPGSPVEVPTRAHNYSLRRPDYACRRRQVNTKMKIIVMGH